MKTLRFCVISTNVNLLDISNHSWTTFIAIKTFILKPFFCHSKYIILNNRRIFIKCSLPKLLFQAYNCVKKYYFFFEKITYFRVQSSNFANTLNSLMGKKYFFSRKRNILVENYKTAPISTEKWIPSRREMCLCKNGKFKYKKIKIILNECIGADFDAKKMMRSIGRKIVKIFIRTKSKSIS